MSEYEETKLKEFIINTIDPDKFEQKQSDIQPFECWLVEDDVEYQEDLTTVTGYDVTQTQVLKHINGVIQWVTE